MPPAPARRGKRGPRRPPRPTETNKRRSGGSSSRNVPEEPDTEVVFSDPYGDEYEEETPATADDSLPTVEAPLRANDAVVFRPGRDKVGQGETLVCDETAYDVFWRCNVEWPALSFDFVVPDGSGAYKNHECQQIASWPIGLMMVMGTQADRGKNKLVCLRMSNVHRNKKKGTVKKMQESDDDSSSDEEEDEEEENDGLIDRNPILQNSDVRMDSVINRVRVMPHRSNIVAAWTEAGRVQLVDVAPALDTLTLDGRHRMRMPNSFIPPSQIRPFFSFSGHRTEGFALDWSRAGVEGRLLSGGMDGGIYLSSPSGREGAKWVTSMDKFRGHSSSVEDLQWSPNEANVFASCSADKSIRFWDTREYRRPALGVAEAHGADVNVISWNRNETHLLVSGGDDGVLKVWDLRSLKRDGTNDGATPAAEFQYHRAPITAVQWHWKDPSMLCASSEDDTVSVWDLAVERDAEEELREGVVLSGAEDLPPQLLFVHMGQKSVKDVQWHPAFPSLMVSTAQDGLNVMQPSNIAMPV